MRRAQATSSRRGFTRGLAIAGLVPFGLVPSSRARPPRHNLQQSTPTAADWNALWDKVSDIVASNQVPGAIVSIELATGDRRDKGFGVSDIERETSIGIYDHFRIGSVTKTMTATIILQLIGEKLIALDDTLEGFVPKLAHGERVTVRQLLAMTSGLFNYTNDEAFLSMILANPSKVWTSDELIERIGDRTLDFEPGTELQYSNTNFVVLGKVIEVVTESSLTDAFEDRIFRPLDMDETFFPTTTELPQTFVRGYSSASVLSGDDYATPIDIPEFDVVDITALNPSIAGAAGAVVSTVGDVQVWMDELMSGTLITEDLQRERLDIHYPSGSGGDLGYGLGIASFEDILGHDGSIYGYQTFAGRAPSGNTIVAMVNLEPGSSGDSFANAIALACFDALEGE